MEREGILVPEGERDIGQTPVGPVELPMGSYLAVLSAPGFRPVRYPVHISRNRDWKGTVRMRKDGEIGEGFVYVPGGPFVYGEGKETRERLQPNTLVPISFQLLFSKSCSSILSFLWTR